ncbi:MAG: Hsp70 family protein, partial [Myxococcaceae bacterium]
RPVAKAGPVFLRPPATIADTGPVIGIDLGTSNSCVALIKNDRPMILSSKEGYNTLPSVISLTNQGKLLLAHRGKSQLILNPSQTIYGAKRLVGRAYDSAVVRQVRERFHYQVVPDQNGRAAVQLGEYVLSLEEVQGLVLKECREMAEQHLGKPVSRAVVTVPAYYSEPQREAVRRAGAMAGLKIERILNEPTAAALAFGLNKELDKKVLVYDLGGGTFDATILKIEKNVFEVLGTGGDVFLGGIDFDNMIVDLLLRRFLEKEGIPFDGDQVALSRVTEAAERAKCALSERATFDVHIPMLMMDAKGVPRELRCTVTRDEVEKATEGLVTRTLDVVRDVLLDAQLKPTDVDEIIVVGGMSRMPLVRDKLKEMFGKLPHAGVNADEAVALGAALYTGTVDKVSSVTLIDVLPMTVGVGLPGGGFRRVIERNTALPAQRSFALATSQDNETSIEFSVFQGEETNIAGNEYLGTVRIEGLPKMPKGTVKVAVTLRLDAECVLHVEAAELSTRKAIKATLATRYTSEEVQKKLGITAEKAREVEERRAKELESRGGGFWGFLKKTFRRK